MDKEAFELGWNFAHSLDLDKTKTNLERLLHEVRRQIGVDGFTWWYGTQDNFFEITTRPKKWMDYYEANHCLLIDPIVKAAFTLQEPFIWSEVLKKMKLSRQEKEFMSLAAEHGLVDGIHLPVGAVIGNFGVLNMFADSSEKIAAAWEKYGVALTSISYTCNRVSLKLHSEETKHLSRLSPQEAKTLTILAAGKQRKEVAKMLEVEVSTIDDYCNNIMSKLETPNIAGAIGIMRSSDLIPFKKT